jgi:hypothetical protein
MKDFREFATSAIVSGFLIVVPAYLAVLLLLRAMSSLAGLVRPIANLFPLWVLAEDAIALLLVLFGCFVIGVAGRTRLGGAARELVERSVLMKIPGYMLFRSLTQQLAGESQENVWKPALAARRRSSLLSSLKNSRTAVTPSLFPRCRRRSLEPSTS